MREAYGQKVREEQARWAAHMERVLADPKASVNLADASAHDEARAVALLAAGRRVFMRNDKMSFSEGRAVVQTFMPYTLPQRLAAIPKPDQGFNWEDWFDKTASAGKRTGYDVYCRMDPAALSNIDKGALFEVDAKLASFGRSVVLECTPAVIEDRKLCDLADGGKYCETVHTCQSGEYRLVLRNESGDLSHIDAVYPNAADPDEWQHSQRWR
ncbi:hypothetical protein [Futiania mangrovi]|uniref:Uncharacterized protein n=1 Tax=Futiania mangrovi TaxID=2959716 RepID=A0A9J6PBG8_9PROT|nr:hypothetical protein [Futiania mangrovii]MCP1335064.1 hypothetical protein [Futiania mangrovii]